MGSWKKLLQLLEDPAVVRDLPETLIPVLHAVAAQPKKYSQQEELVEKLVGQLVSFDLYAGGGCFCDSASAADIQKTLQELDPFL
ncbi:GSU3529 family protein [Trichloromonas sp.]|uniref:GSU3529 family protein n=1 Tax=Trichloromonas sp. TaxID=3069249 RepID=UPI002A39ACD6|nr:hypothetical protein [Trichloromonas sp.]